MSPLPLKLPTFVYCRDGKYYEDLVYQDFPTRRDWFICFDPDEPAEFVLKEEAWRGGFKPENILKHRGFDEKVLARLVNGRKDAHRRFFGELHGTTEREKALGCHNALSWFLIFRKGAPLPSPQEHDSCAEIWPIYPNKAGVYFGVKS